MGDTDVRVTPTLLTTGYFFDREGSDLGYGRACPPDLAEETVLAVNELAACGNLELEEGEEGWGYFGLLGDSALIAHHYTSPMRSDRTTKPMLQRDALLVPQGQMEELGWDLFPLLALFPAPRALFRGDPLPDVGGFLAARPLDEQLRAVDRWDLREIGDLLWLVLGPRRVDVDWGQPDVELITAIFAILPPALRRRATFCTRTASFDATRVKLAIGPSPKPTHWFDRKRVVAGEDPPRSALVDALLGAVAEADRGRELAELHRDLEDAARRSGATDVAALTTLMGGVAEQRQARLAVLGAKTTADRLQALTVFAREGSTDARAERRRWAIEQAVAPSRPASEEELDALLSFLAELAGLTPAEGPALAARLAPSEGGVEGAVALVRAVVAARPGRSAPRSVVETLVDRCLALAEGPPDRRLETALELLELGPGEAPARLGELMLGWAFAEQPGWQVAWRLLRLLRTPAELRRLDSNPTLRGQLQQGPAAAVALGVLRAVLLGDPIRPAMLQSVATVEPGALLEIVEHASELIRSNRGGAAAWAAVVEVAAEGLVAPRVSADPARQSLARAFAAAWPKAGGRADLPQELRRAVGDVLAEAGVDANDLPGLIPRGEGTRSTASRPRTGGPPDGEFGSERSPGATGPRRVDGEPGGRPVRATLEAMRSLLERAEGVEPTALCEELRREGSNAEVWALTAAMLAGPERGAAALTSGFLRGLLQAVLERCTPASRVSLIPAVFGAIRGDESPCPASRTELLLSTLRVYWDPSGSAEAAAMVHAASFLFGPTVADQVLQRALKGLPADEAVRLCLWWVEYDFREFVDPGPDIFTSLASELRRVSDPKLRTEMSASCRQSLERIREAIPEGGILRSLRGPVKTIRDRVEQTLRDLERI